MEPLGHFCDIILPDKHKERTLYYDGVYYRCTLSFSDENNCYIELYSGDIDEPQTKMIGVGLCNVLYWLKIEQENWLKSKQGKTRLVSAAKVGDKLQSTTMWVFNWERPFWTFTLCPESYYGTEKVEEVHSKIHLPTKTIEK